jgi:hypothetical protein
MLTSKAVLCGWSIVVLVSLCLPHAAPQVQGVQAVIAEEQSAVTQAAVGEF